MLKQLVFLILSLPLSCLAQVSLTGRVINQADGKPVPLASVFLSNATIGDKTATDGTFSLHNIAAGKYELVISVIGFETYLTKITVGNADATMHDIAINPKSIALQEVVVKPNNNRARNYQWFKDQFLGTSELAQQCKILNPEVLDLDYDNATNALTGSSSDFLEIENPALGYRIRYLLTNFSFLNKSNDDVKIYYKGSVLYQEMAGSSSQVKRWKERREEVYENSEMHFLRALIHNRMNEEGFRVFQLSNYANPERPSDSLVNARLDHFLQLKKKGEKHPDSIAYWTKKSKLPKMLQKLNHRPLTPDEILFEADQPGLYALGCNMDGLLISYNKTRHFSGGDQLTYLNTPRNTENTLVNFSSPFAFSYGNGVLVNPYSVIYYGVWGRNRVAEQLPIDYISPIDGTNDRSAADSLLAKSLIAKAEGYKAGHITENAYLHFDKPYYAAGDTMYFKAYVTAGDSNRLSQISGVLHVDLINTANKIDQSILLHLTDGVAWGDFTLPDSLPQGNYRVRAYTRLMLNIENSWFDQNIPVGSVNIKKVSESATAKPQGTPDIQFFPEGGHLVSGIRSKIAFKAIAGNGSGIEVKGEVLDSDNKQVAAFASTHLGMGEFYLQPEAEKNYTVKMTYNNGNTTTLNLPLADENGVQLSVDNSFHAKTVVTIAASKAYFKANANKNLTVIAYSAGAPSTYICKLDSQTVQFSVLKNTLHTGITTITLFGSDGEPVSERLFFVQHDDGLKLLLTTDEKANASRAPVNFKLNTRTIGNSLSSGHFSVSVIDEHRVPVEANTEHTIFTDLLLTGQLKGYVEQPDYYFSNPDTKTNADLDLVMLTHGYRRFEWKKVLNSPSGVSAYKPEPGLEIDGIVKSKDNKPIPGGIISLLPMGGGPASIVNIDNNGGFSFSNMVFKDSSSFVLRAKNESFKNRLGVIYKAADPIVVNASPIPVMDQDAIDNLLASYLENRKKQLVEFGALKGMMLKEVKVRELRKQNEYRTASLAGAGFADQVMQRKDFKSYAAGFFSDVFNGRLLGVSFLGIEAGGKIPFLSVPGYLHGNSSMLIVIDGATMDQTFSPDEININDVETVEVLKNSAASAYGALGGNGVLVITTRTGYDEPSATALASGVLPVKPKGFYVAREFYTPKYLHPETDANRKDLRSTIYWKPELVTDTYGNATFDYYNADAGNYRVVVEGIDDSGNLGRLVYRYIVK